MKNLLWSIFGNDEEPTPPNWYLPGKGARYRYWMWLLYRNPLHNMTWHLLGFVGEDEYKTAGLFPKHVWNPYGGFNWMVHARALDAFGYPFVSYRGKYIEWYLGWRERGNLGASIRRANS